jgi:hypothetical protein
MGIPALVNAVPITCIRPGDGNVKVVTLAGPSPTTKVGILPLAVTIGASLTTMTSDGAGAVTLVTAIVKDNGCFVVLAGSTLTLPSGHIGVVPTPIIAGTVINLT